MNTYELNIEKFNYEIKDLSVSEVGIYINFINQYLLTEKPLTSDWICDFRDKEKLKTPDEKIQDHISNVLNKFFAFDSLAKKPVWHCPSLDSLIAKSRGQL